MNDILGAQNSDLSLIYNHLSESVFLIDVKDNERFSFVSVNRAFLQNTGLSEQAVVGRLVEEVIPEPYLEAALKQYKEAVKTKVSVQREEIAEYPSGMRVSLITITPYLDAGAIITRLVGSIQDITERVAAEKKVVQNSVKLQGILDSSPDIICTLNEQGVLKSVSAAAGRMLGYAQSLFIGKPLLNFVALKYHQSTESLIAMVIQGENTTSFENELVHKDGTFVPVIWSMHWNPSLKEIYCTIREAREKRIAEKMLSESEKRFKAMVHDGSDMITILDDRANYRYVSPSSKRVLDIEPEMFVGRNAFEFIHPDDVEKAHREFATAAGQKKVSLSPFRFKHNNGAWRWIQTIVTDLRETPEINGFVANSRDVTDVVEAQKALEASNERYHYVSRATSDAIWDYDITTSTLLWGEGFLKTFGYPEKHAAIRYPNLE
ncbi:MAG: PAS domain S-box protein [Sphingobacteriales bacterium]|nr:MAG: PAS domain S-box protein [Sphingobacteriales bacterium]